MAVSFSDDAKLALADIFSWGSVSVTYLDTETQTSYTRNAVRYQMEGYGNPYVEWHWYLYSNATTGIAAPKNGDTITYSSVEYVVGKVTRIGDGAGWDLWTRTPEVRI